MADTHKWKLWNTIIDERDVWKLHSAITCEGKTSKGIRMYDQMVKILEAERLSWQS